MPQDDGPWGARGIGEHAMVPTIPAIANAIYDAIGIRPGAPPFSSEKVYLAMLEAEWWNERLVTRQLEFKKPLPPSPRRWKNTRFPSPNAGRGRVSAAMLRRDRYGLVGEQE